MNAIKQGKNIVAILLISMVSTLHAMNLSRPHDIFFRPPAPEEQFMQAYVWTEFGLKQIAYASDNKITNILQYLDCNQNALKMLDGFGSETPIGQKRAQLPVVDDGIRGHYSVSGDLDVLCNMAFAWRFFFGHNINLGVYLPLRSMKLHNVCWCNMTENNNYQDALTREYLTNDFFTIVSALGNDLSLGDWSRTGIGDLEIIFEFLRNFEQQKPLLKNVLLNLRAGLTFPTGLKTDPDHIVSLPFGNDGAATVLFGAGLEMLYGTWFKFGFDVELTHLFGNTRERRIKTASDQTSFLYLAKTCAYKDWGMQQQFTLYAQLYHFYKAFSCKLAYRFFKQGDSNLSLSSADYFAPVVNTSTTLEDWTAHDILCKVSYDWSLDYDRVNPGCALFVRIPCNGKRSIVSNTLGLMLSVDF